MSHHQINVRNKTNTTQSHCKSFERYSTWFSVYVIRPKITLHPYTQLVGVRVWLVVLVKVRVLVRIWVRACRWMVLGLSLTCRVLWSIKEDLMVHNYVYCIIWENSLSQTKVPLAVKHQQSTVRPLLSAELDYPPFLRPKFGTPNLYEIR